MRRRGMCRIADDHNAARMPATERDPLNRPDAQRIGSIQAVQVRRDKPTEVGEVLAKTIKHGAGLVRPTLRHAIVLAFRGDSALTASPRTVERNPSAPTTRS